MKEENLFPLIEIENLQKDIKKNKINKTVAEMLLATAAITNKQINQINNEGMLLITVSREGYERSKPHPLLNSINNNFMLIDKLLKSSQIVKSTSQLAKEAKLQSKIETPEDGLKTFLSKINKR